MLPIADCIITMLSLYSWSGTKPNQFLFKWRNGCIVNLSLGPDSIVTRLLLLFVSKLLEVIRRRYNNNNNNEKSRFSGNVNEIPHTLQRNASPPSCVWFDSFSPIVRNSFTFISFGRPTDLLIFEWKSFKCIILSASTSLKSEHDFDNCSSHFCESSTFYLRHKESEELYVNDGGKKKSVFLFCYHQLHFA